MKPYVIYARIFQAVLWVGNQVLKTPVPELIEGENSLQKLSARIKQQGVKHVLVICDRTTRFLDQMDTLLAGMDELGIQHSIYDKTVANPTIDNIEEALSLYKADGCDGLVAFGGGSPMDCAKAVGARVACPEKSIPQLKGLLKVGRKIPPLFAIPTTSGTGSEVTLAAVVTNAETHEKYAINDMKLVPIVAVLDPTVTLSLPPRTTATTGMDALTHAVEAYINRGNTAKTAEMALTAVKLIYKNLYNAYSDGSDMAARSAMQIASFDAGYAFTRAYVGDVHAIAHTLGGFYNMPHGLANAVIMPYVLEAYGEAAHKRLADLADAAGLEPADTSVEGKAKAFIASIRDLNQSMEIPEKLEGIKDEDIPAMVKNAMAEANPLYPVPRILFKDDFVRIYKEIQA